MILWWFASKKTLTAEVLIWRVQSYQWPPPAVENPWNKEYSPKDFPTSHNIPSTLPICWELHEDSPLMMKPPTSAAVEQVKDAKIAKCPYWLEAFATRSAHSATISATSLEVVYNFLQKVIIFLRSSEAKDSVANDASLLDNLLRRANIPRGSADVSWFWRHLDRTLHAFSYATQTYSLRISFCQPPSER